MITHIYKDDDGSTVAVTVGCGCCSTNISDRNEIISELFNNVAFIERACKELKISYTELKRLKNENSKKKNIRC